PDPGLPLDDVQGLAHSLRGRPAADVQEVGGAPAEMRQEVERAHHQARAVADDGDVAVELDVGQPAGPGLPLEGGQLVRGEVAGATVSIPPPPAAAATATAHRAARSVTNAR